MSRLLTWVLRLLPLLGVVLAVIGSQEWYPAGWLDSKGFVINLASGFTAACFGIPIAFFVLQDLLKQRASSEQKKAIVLGALENVIGACYLTFLECNSLRASARAILKNHLDVGSAGPDWNVGPTSEEELLRALDIIAYFAKLRSMDLENVARAKAQYVATTVNDQLIGADLPPAPQDVLDEVREYSTRNIPLPSLVQFWPTISMNWQILNTETGEMSLAGIANDLADPVVSPPSPEGQGVAALMEVLRSLLSELPEHESYLLNLALVHGHLDRQLEANTARPDFPELAGTS